MSVEPDAVESTVVTFAKKYVYALVSSLYMFTVGIASRRSRQMVHNVADYFGYPNQTLRCTVPSVGADEITEPETEISLLEPEWVSGNVTLFQMLVMMRIVREASPETIFEIGTFDGRTTLNFAANTKGSAAITTLDLPADQLDSAALPMDVGDREYIEKPASGERFHGTAFEEKISQVFGDSATFDFSPYKGEIDLVFIDGSHSYEYVKSDTAAALDMLGEQGGWILWDDYSVWPGVTQALNELYSSDSAFSGMRHVEGTSLAVARITPDSS